MITAAIIVSGAGTNNGTFTVEGTGYTTIVRSVQWAAAYEAEQRQTVGAGGAA